MIPSLIGCYVKKGAGLGGTSRRDLCLNDDRL